MKWEEITGDHISAALSVSGPYVISHRPDSYTLSYRPKGKHEHVGTFGTVAEAKREAQTHSEKAAG